MPIVEITAEQQAALDRGESITITHPSPEHVAVHIASGSVYLTRGPLDNAEWRALYIPDDRDAERQYGEWARGRIRINFRDSVYSTIPLTTGGQ